MHKIGEIIENKLKVINIQKRTLLRKNGKKDKVYYYQYECLNCGFDCGQYHYKNKTYDELWVENITGCSCCEGHFCVTGINDIGTTDPWMIPYFKNKNDAKKYRSRSQANADMVCPDCGKLLPQYRIASLYYKHKVVCTCNEKMSIPNKFAYNLFIQLENQNQLSNYIREYSPKWAGLFRYDNFFIIDNSKYIVEVDGDLGHGRKTFKNQQDKDGFIRDKIKSSIAEEYDINIIRIYAPYKNADYMLFLTNQFVSGLKDLFNFSKIDWNCIYENVYKNTIKAVCEYYNTYHSDGYPHNFMSLIAKHFKMNNNTIRRYLKDGDSLGWCNFVDSAERENQIYHCIIADYNNAIDHTNLVNILAEKYRVANTTVRRYLKEATKNGECLYDGNENLKNFHNHKVIIYDLNHNKLKEYKSQKQCHELFKIDFGISISLSMLTNISCGKRNNIYNNYIIEV